MKKLIASILATVTLAPAASIAQEITIRSRFVSFLEETYKTSHASVIVEHVFEVSERKNLDPMLIFSIIAVESRFNPNAKNPSGATGLMQVMVPMHCKRFPDHSKCRQLALNPEDNIEVGTDILVEYKGNLKRYSGNTPGYEQMILKKQKQFQQLYKDAKLWNIESNPI